MVSNNLTKEETGFADESWQLNPMQTLVHEFRDQPGNMVVVAQTASGKTTVINLRAFRYLYPKNPANRKKLLYVAPMKALVEEKKRDWIHGTHPYSEFNVAIITGDYVGAFEKDEKALDNAEIVVITPESLASRLRNRMSEKNRWLEDIGLVCIDEIHLISTKGRGATLEAALMELTATFPKVELLGLSATMPNAEQLADWIATLNKHETFIVESDYRPVKLHKHYIPIEADSYDELESARIDEIVRLHDEHPNDNFLICVFQKTFGKKILERLQKEDRVAEFHNADRTKQERALIEKQFLCGDMNSLVCTSTLFVGMNLPARRVIVTWPMAGGEDVAAADLLQAAGRAGRPQFDPEGDAYFFLPAAPRREFERHMLRIENGEPIESKLNTPAEIALHFLGAVNLGRIQSREDFHKWYNRSFFQFQRKLTEKYVDSLLESIFDAMEKRGMIKITKHDESDPSQDVVSLRRRGLIACQMAVDPYYLYDLLRNFKKYFSLIRADDAHLASALASCGPFYRRPSKNMQTTTPQAIKNVTEQNYWEVATIYYRMLRNESNQIPGYMFSTKFQLIGDIDRVAQSLMRLDKETERWEEEEKIIALPSRVKQGVDWKVGRLMGEGATLNQARQLVSRDVFSMSLQRDPKYADIFAKVMRSKWDDDYE